MKQHDITKICADSLRSFLNEKHNIKLGSSHAHELVAAFFEYQSRAALLADKTYPLSNLAKAEFILLDPPITFVDQRFKSLEGLPPDLPSSNILVEAIYSAIKNDKKLLEKVQSSFRDLALSLADECLNREMRMWRMHSESFNWIKDVTVEEFENDVLMTVCIGYRTNAGERLRYRKYDIRLPRISANLGYGEPELHETHYSGDAAKYSDEELLKKYPIVLTPVA